MEMELKSNEHYMVVQFVFGCAGHNFFFIDDQRYAESTNLIRHLAFVPGGLQKKCKSTQGKPTQSLILLLGHSLSDPNF